MLWAIDYGCLLLILACAVVVVQVDNLNGAVIGLSGLGTISSLLFVVLGAPDDAHAEVVVGAIALPVLYLVAIGKIRASLATGEGTGETEGEDEAAGASDR